ncbi:hypothetical protein EYF80_055418 [Liparis tanakae]|uniref:Uncharacterized protein n=1 Tax=Liparis tanakae TaxID=230148 RepID=A0A4Z2F1S3_9TELE|nr:hypothetical protein EYF80_055418 [Liparis tanakae]
MYPIAGACHIWGNILGPVPSSRLIPNSRSPVRGSNALLVQPTLHSYLDSAKFYMRKGLAVSTGTQLIISSHFSRARSPSALASERTQGTQPVSVGLRTHAGHAARQRWPQNARRARSPSVSTATKGHALAQQGTQT